MNQWTGKKWEPLLMDFRGFNGTHTPVCYDMTVDGQGRLYIVGNFEQENGDIRNIARWDGEAWSSLGTALPYNDEVNVPYKAIALGPDGSIFVAGDFRAVDGLPVNDIIQLSPKYCSPDGIVYVRKEATGLHDGSSWDNAFTELRDALHFVKQGTCSDIQQIWVAAGTYTPSPNNGEAAAGREQYFSMQPGLAIYGGLSGTEAPDYDMSLRDFETHATILSGDLAGNDALGAYEDNSKHIFATSNSDYYAPEAPPFTVDGFILQGAKSESGGGAIKSWYLPIVIKNCQFLNNNCSYIYSNGAAIGDGGAVYTYEASAEFEYCLFSGNSSGRHGGAVYLNKTPANFYECRFVNNHSAKNSGGAINSSGSSSDSLVISACTFINNSSLFGGGAISSSTVSLRIENSEFKGNTNYGLGGGGALHISNASNNIISNISFEGNSSAAGRGGAIHSKDSNVIIENSHFHLNQAKEGGAFYKSHFNGSHSYEFSNCTFQANSAYEDGGVIYEEKESEASLITNCTIVGNYAEQDYGLYYGPMTNLTIENSIVYGNWDTEDKLYKANNIVVRNSIFQQSSEPTEIDITPIEGLNAKDLDPTDLFISFPSVYEAGDLRLPGNSPAANRGIGATINSEQ